MKRAYSILLLFLCLIVTGATAAHAFSFVWHESAFASLELSAFAECWGFHDPDYGASAEYRQILTHPGAPLPLTGSARAQVPPGDYAHARGTLGRSSTSLAVDTDTNYSDDGDHGSRTRGRATGSLTRSFHLTGGEGSVFVTLPFRIHGSLAEVGSGVGYIQGSFRAGIGGVGWLDGLRYGDEEGERFDEIYYWTGFLDFGRTYEWSHSLDLYGASGDGRVVAGDYNLTVPGLASPVPEPGSFVLLAAGLVFTGVLCRRRTSS